jgi:hypothetical protein
MPHFKSKCITCGDNVDEAHMHPYTMKHKICCNLYWLGVITLCVFILSRMRERKQKNKRNCGWS